MSEFKISCPTCQQHLTCEESYRGAEFACPTCGGVITVPAAASSPVPGGLRIGHASPASAVPHAMQPHVVRSPQRPSVPTGKSWITTFMLAFFLGGFGVDRFYTGRIGLGIAKLLTTWFCGLWIPIDIILLLMKKYQDAQGNYLQPAKRGHMVTALAVMGSTILLGVIVAGSALHAIKSEFAKAMGGAPTIDFESLQGGAGTAGAGKVGVSFIITFDGVPSRQSATAKGLLEQVNYDHSLPATLEETKSPLQSKLSFYVPVSAISGPAGLDAMAPQIRNSPGVIDVRRSSVQFGGVLKSDDFKQLVTAGARDAINASRTSSNRQASATRQTRRVATAARAPVPIKRPDTSAQRASTAATDLITTSDQPRNQWQMLPELANASAKNPADTVAALKVAALQLWFYRLDDYDITRQRMLNWAVHNEQTEAASRVAEIASLRANPISSAQKASLNLARSASTLDKTNSSWPWAQSVRGMAEFRSGHYQAADEALMDAVQGAQTFVAARGSSPVSVSKFYHAMSLFQQGKADEARQLFRETALTMKPLPADEQNPLAGDADQDDLILWLAYKEAKSLLKEPDPVRP